MRLTINGRLLELPSDVTVLDAIHQAGIRLPALCHDSRMKASGNFRLCLVEIDGCERPVPSCYTRATEGMQIRTHTPELEAGRKAILGLLAQRYPDHHLRQWPDKPFHQWLRKYGLAGSTAESEIAVDESHPYIIHNERISFQICSGF